ncbi:3104_t:CDS:2, partial [Cetraspora pellucida]
MTSPTPTVQKKSKKSKTTDPTVKLPKAKFNVPDEETGEKQGEIAAKPANEEASQKDPVIDTKPDIFQTTPQDDDIIIVNYPNINAKREKDSHIHDTLDALNGTRREGNAPLEMPPAAIEALERMLGKVPDPNKPRGSNVGKLDQGFTFPPRTKSSPNNSSNHSNNATASTSKISGGNKEIDQDDLDKKERDRRRKSNLNPFAQPFTFSAGTSVDANKSIDASEQKHDDDRKKKNTKKEKLNHEMNGDTDSSYPKRKRRPSQPLITSEAARQIDAPYGFAPNGYEPNAYYMHGPHTPYLPNHVEGATMPNWEEFQTKMAVEVVSRIESQFQKGVVTLTSEIKNILVEHISEDYGVSGKKNDEGTTLRKLQDQIFQELRNNHQEIRTTYDQLMHKYEEMQNRHLDQVSSLQTVQDGDIQNSITQRHAELQTMHHNLKTELKTGLKEIHNEYLNMLDRQQQLNNDIKNSQVLQSRLAELESELNQLRIKNTHLTSENSRLFEENHNAKMKERQYDEGKRQQETLISELETEISNHKDKASRAGKELELIRSTVRSLEAQKTGLESHNGSLENKIRNLEVQIRNLQNDHNSIFEENQALQQQQDKWRKTEKSLQSDINELSLKLLKAESEYNESKRKIIEDQNSFKTKEDNLREQLKEANQQVIEARSDQRRLKELENEMKTLKSSESAQLKSKNMEIDGLNKQLAQLRQRVSDLEKNRTELQQSSQKEIAALRASNQGAESQLLELREKHKTLEEEASNTRKYSKELENKVLKIKEYETRIIEYEDQSAELKNFREEFENLKQKIKGMNDIEAQNLEKIEELSRLRIRVQELENAEKDLEYIRGENIDLTKRLEALETEKKKQLENNHSQKNASTTSNTYSYGGREPKMNGFVTEFEDRMISRDHQPLYNNQLNGNSEQIHYNSGMKPPTEYNSQQTFSQSPAIGGINLTQTQSMPHMMNGTAQQPSQHQTYIPPTPNSAPPLPPQHIQPTYHLSHNGPPPSQPPLQAFVPLSQLHSSQSSVPIHSNTPALSQKVQQKQDHLQQQQSPLPQLVPSQQAQSNQGQSTVKQETKSHSRQSSRSNNVGGSGKKQRSQNAKKKDRNRRNSTTDSTNNPWSK